MKNQVITRKRALISSVAMLMVAILALGTATYAWFSAKDTATATGISMKASAASGLLVSLTGNEGTWGDSVVLYDATADDGDGGQVGPVILNPASCAFDGASLTAPTFYKAIADSPNSYEATTFTAVTAGEAKDYYAKYDFYAKTADGSTKELKISTTSLFDDGGYGRIAIVTGTSIKLYYKAAGDAGIFPISDDGTVADAYPITPVSTISSISLGNISTSTQFSIFVWNEGQDAECKSTNGEKAMTADFSLTVA